MCACAIFKINVTCWYFVFNAIAFIYFMCILSVKIYFGVSVLTYFMQIFAYKQIAQKESNMETSFYWREIILSFYTKNPTFNKSSFLFLPDRTFCTSCSCRVCCRHECSCVSPDWLRCWRSCCTRDTGAALSDAPPGCAVGARPAKRNSPGISGSHVVL